METEGLLKIEELAQMRITAKSDIAPHEFLFTWNDTPCFAKGELVAVTGKAKSGKTYLNSILMAAAGVNNTNLLNEEPIPFLGLRRNKEEPYRVLWIDTEQSEDTTYEILQDRIRAMIGEEPSEDIYHVYNMRRRNWKERLDYVILAIGYCQPDLVIFDGIRDVVSDINNYDEAQMVLDQLLAIASHFHPCIVCVLHQNKASDDKTLRGAIGTELQNKSFETYECSKDEQRVFTIKQSATRKYDMANSVKFIVSAQGLPSLYFAEVAEKKEAKDYGFNPKYVDTDGKLDKRKLFCYLLPPGHSMELSQLRAASMNVAGIRVFGYAYRVIQEACAQGILQEEKKDGKTYYRFAQF